MKIEKLPSGSYRIRKMYKGVTYTVVTDYKPTQKEALQLLSAEMDKIQTEKQAMTFKIAAQNYIELKNNILSPSTLKGYNSILRSIPETFSETRLSDIDAVAVQKYINDHSSGHSPKCTRNVHGFISAVLSTYRPDLIINTSLPQKLKNEPYIPSDDDVKRVLEYARGTKFEVALILATFGLRRSEICALTMDDLVGNTLTINKALVQAEDKSWIIKTTKTEAGTRQIYLPDAVADLIREKGIYKGYPNSIANYLYKVQEQLGIPHFSLHKLRHYYASMSHALGIPDSYIMAAGGWKSDNVLRNVYRHALDDKKEEMQRQAAEHISALIP